MSLTAFKRKSVINYGSKRSGIPPGGYWLPQGPFGHSTQALKDAIHNFWHGIYLSYKQNTKLAHEIPKSIFSLKPTAKQAPKAFGFLENKVFIIKPGHYSGDTIKLKN